MLGLKILILNKDINEHMTQQKSYAIIVAGGQGTRMGMALPKQFLPLNNKPILYYTIQAFINAIPDIQIILVLPEEHISYSNMVMQAFEEVPEITIVPGGNTRYESVQNGLDLVLEEDAIVFVHDGVRPFISKNLIKSCYNQAKELGSAIPCIPVVDSIRQINEEQHQAVNRNNLRIIQTPQTFIAKNLLAAFAQPYQDSFTDEASVLENAGWAVHLIDGDKYNIKITHPEDLIIGEAILQITTKA